MTDYSNALNGHSRPLETLRARVNRVKNTDSQMQAWVQAVADATEQHAQQLERILSKHSISEQDLGTFGSAWDAVASVVLANAQTSASSARRLRSEVEQPLKQLARTYDRTTSAVVADATYSSGAATEVQEADLARAQGIRDALLRMQTLFVDSAQDVQKSAEKSSNALLNFNPQDEGESFVAQIVSGVAPTEPTRRGPSQSQAPKQSQSLRAASSQTFVHNAQRKPSRMSMAESQHSEKKRTGLRAKVGSIFRKPKGGADRMSPVRTGPSDRFSERFSERSERAPSETPSAGIARTPSVRKPQQPTTTQPPDFGLRPRDFGDSTAEDEPLSSLRSRRNGQNAPQVQPRTLSSPTQSPSDSPDVSTGAYTSAPDTFPSGPSSPVGAPVGVLQPIQRNSDRPQATTSLQGPSSPTSSSAPSVPPPRGGRKINSIYFSGVSAAPRESVIEIPEDRAVDDSSAFPPNMSSSSLGNSSQIGRSNSLRRPLKRDFTGQQSQQHPALPLVENGPAASIMESLTAVDRNGNLDNVLISGDVRFASPVPIQLQVINARHLASFTPTDALSSVEPGVYSFDPSRHVPGASLATYTGSFPALLPLSITPQWQVTDTQTRLIIFYQIAKDYPLETVTLQNLTIAASVSGGTALSAHSKPLATFSREKQKLTWRFNQPVELRKGQPERLVCQFVTTGPAYEAPEGVEARFEILNAPTAIGLEVASDSKWVPVKTAATAYTQRYTATSQ